jgi:hypothetical protein
LNILLLLVARVVVGVTVLLAQTAAAVRVATGLQQGYQ